MRDGPADAAGARQPALVDGELAIGEAGGNFALDLRIEPCAVAARAAGGVEPSGRTSPASSRSTRCSLPDPCPTWKPRRARRLTSPASSSSRNAAAAGTRLVPNAFATEVSFTTVPSGSVPSRMLLWSVSAISLYIGRPTRVSPTLPAGDAEALVMLPAPFKAAHISRCVQAGWANRLNASSLGVELAPGRCGRRKAPASTAAGSSNQSLIQGIYSRIVEAGCQKARWT